MIDKSKVIEKVIDQLWAMNVDNLDDKTVITVRITNEGIETKREEIRFNSRTSYVFPQSNKKR